MKQYEKLNVTSDAGTLPKMKVNLVQKQQNDKWQLGDWGILGISPRGSFFEYLRTIYSKSETISLAAKHTLSEADSDNDLLRYSVQVFLNPDKSKHYKDANVLGPFTTPEGQDHWTVKGSVSLGDTPFGYKDQNICLSSIGNELFGVIDSLVWCNQIKKIVCDGDTKHCTKTKADLDKAPVITFMFEDKEVQFGSDDYIYFKNDDLQCRFGDVCDQRSEAGVCDQATEVVLGKLFFEKYTPMFNLDTKTGNTSVAFIKDFKAPKERVIIWLVVGIVAALIALLALVYIIVKKRKELAANPDDSYEAVVNDPEEEIDQKKED